jgi:DNA polymerase III subunit epsilon
MCPGCRRSWWTQIAQERVFPISPVHGNEQRCVRCRRCTAHLQSSQYCSACSIQWSRDRDAAIFWARTLLPPRYSRHDWVILDTETTGLDRMAEIVEVSIIASDGHVLFDTLVRPLNPIPATATAIHHISDGMVAAAPRFPEVYSELIELLQGRVVVTYNAAFDRGVLRQAQQLYELPAIPSIRWSCAMQQYARYRGEWNAARRAYRWKHLETGDHTALGDCRATLRLIQHMAASKLRMEEGIAGRWAKRSI